MLTTPFAWMQRHLKGLRDRLHRRPGIRTAFVNTAWLLADKGLRMVLYVLVGAWVARHLGPNQYGQLAYVVALVGFFQVVAGLGIDQILVRDLARDPATASALLGTSVRLRIGAGLAGWVMLAVLAVSLRPDDHVALVLAVALGAGLVFQAADVVDAWLMSRARSKVSVLPKACAYAGSAAIKILLIVEDAPLWAFGVALLGDSALVAAALVWAYRREPTAESWQWQSSRVRGLLWQAAPLLVSGLSVVVYMRIDQVLLRELAGERALGLYSAILPFSQVWHIVPMTLCASLLPRMAVLQAEDPGRYKLRLQQLFTLMAWGGVGAATLTALAAAPLVEVLLGPEFTEATGVLRWHAVCNVFVFLGVAQSLAIVNAGNTGQALFRTLCGAVTSIVMNLLLIPNWGVLGAAWASIAAYFVASVASNAIAAPGMLVMQLKAFWPFHVQRP